MAALGMAQQRCGLQADFMPAGACGLRLHLLIYLIIYLILIVSVFSGVATDLLYRVFNRIERHFFLCRGN